MLSHGCWSGLLLLKHLLGIEGLSSISKVLEPWVSQPWDLHSRLRLLRTYSLKTFCFGGACLRGRTATCASKKGSRESSGEGFSKEGLLWVLQLKKGSEKGSRKGLVKGGLENAA